jgi:chloramphenicol 3-O-phosphotransferase
VRVRSPRQLLQQLRTVISQLVQQLLLWLLSRAAHTDYSAATVCSYTVAAVATVPAVDVLQHLLLLLVLYSCSTWELLRREVSMADYQRGRVTAATQEIGCNSSYQYGISTAAAAAAKTTTTAAAAAETRGKV